MDNEELVILYKEGDKKALELIIKQNMNIIYKLANKYTFIKDKSVEIEDLIQSGIIGLIKGVNKYDVNNPNKAMLITYAIYCIDREMRVFYYGASEKEKSNKELINNCLSINVSIDKEGEEELSNFIEGIDYSFENVIEIEFIRELRIQLEECMKELLTLKEREIIEFRYKWNGIEMTFKEIGEIYNISAERVRQIETRILRKLRNSKWVRENAKEFAELGYINEFYMRIFKERGINL